MIAIVRKMGIVLLFDQNESLELHQNLQSLHSERNYLQAEPTWKILVSAKDPIKRIVCELFKLSINSSLDSITEKMFKRKRRKVCANYAIGTTLSEKK